MNATNIIFCIAVLLTIITSVITLLWRKETQTVKKLEETLPIQGAYQKAWLFSFNEKNAYAKLKPIAEELGYTVFAKVRLLDLVNPVKGTRKYKTYFYKIQAKHVDFVLCDKKLVVRYIIELDDSSHDTEERKKRDQFVDEVVQSVGYPIIHVRGIDESIRQKIKEQNNTPIKK